MRVLLGILALLLLGWLLLGPMRSRDANRPTSLPPTGTTNANATILDHAPRLDDIQRVTVRSPAEAAARSSDTANSVIASPGGLTGTFEYSDGSRVPDITFELASLDRVELPRANETTRDVDLVSHGACRDAAKETADTNGVFRVDGLCAGRYSLRILRPSGVSVVNPVVEVPATNARIVLAGYTLAIHTVDALGRACANAHVEVEFSADSQGRDAHPASFVIRCTSGEDGRADVILPGPGHVGLSAWQVDRTSVESTLDLQGPSRTVPVDVLLDRSREPANLRVVALDCTTRAPITDYCIVVDSSSSGERWAHLDSALLSSDGLFHSLPPGEFDVRLAPRYLGSAVCYVVGDLSSAHVTLRSGQDSLVQLCADLGGRLSLVVESDASQGATENPTQSRVAARFHASIVSASGGEPQRLNFRRPDATGVTISNQPTFGEACVTENVLQPGRHVLTIRADEYDERTVVVDVVAGRVTSATIALRRARSPAPR